MKKNLLLTALFVLFTATISLAQDNTSYRSSLKLMMQLSGSEGAYKAAVNQMIIAFKQSQPTVPAVFWDEMTLEMNKVALDQIVDLVLPVYQKHFSEDDIKGIIAFYKTPIGQKFAEKTPIVTQESMAAGQVWGKSIGEKVVKSLQEKGYLKQ